MSTYSLYKRSVRSHLKSSIIPLLFCTAALLLNNSINVYKAFRKDIEVSTQMVTETLHASVDLHDQKEVTRLLKILKNSESVIGAFVVDRAGTTLSNVGEKFSPPYDISKSELKEEFSASAFFISLPIELNGKTVGDLHLKLSIHTMASHLLSDFLALIVTALLCYFLSNYLARKEAKAVSKPLSELSSILDSMYVIDANEFSLKKEALEQARKTKIDDSIEEVNTLFSHFINLMSKLGNSFKELEKMNAELETRVTMRTHQLATALHQVSQYQYAMDEAAILFVIDKSGLLTHANKHFLEISGFSRQELIGTDFRSLMLETHLEQFYENIWNHISSGKVWKGEISFCKKDGTHYWTNMTIVPYTEVSQSEVSFCKPNIIRFAAIGMDITAAKIAEQNLLLSSKMASLGEMAGGIAHEINNPLAIIHGKATVLNKLSQRDQLDKEQIKSCAEKIISTTDRIAQIIKGLRVFSRDADQDSFEFTGLDQIVEDTLSLCLEKFRKQNIKFIVSSIPQISIPCSATKVSQALFNLLINANDAVALLEDKWVKLDFEITAEKLRIMVTDSGSGIPHEIARKLMQPFFTTKEIGKGTGLGLSVSKGIVESHGGILFYDSSCPNTRFVMELPIVQKQTLAA